MATTVADLEIVVGADTSQAEAGLSRVGNQVEQTGKKSRLSAADFAAAGGIFTSVGAGIVGSFGYAINTAADFEAQVSAVGSVTGATGDQLRNLEQLALELGSSTSLSATEAAQAMEIMAKAGASYEDLMNGAAKAAINLAEATGEDITLSAETAATAMNVFGISGKQAADLIAQSANASAIGVNDWNLAMAQAGGTARTAGMSADDFAASLMILADNAITGEKAGTALRNILGGLMDTTNEGTQALMDMGIAVYDAEGNFRGLEAITGDLASAWKNMTQEQKLALAEQIAGMDGAAAFMAIMDEQVKSIDAGTTAFEERKKAMAGVGTAEEQAAARMDNFRGALEELKGALETATIIVGNMFLPVLQRIAEAGQQVIQWFINLSPAVQKTIAVFMGVVGVGSLLAGGLLLAKAALMGLGAVFGSLLLPIAGVITAVAALAAGMYYAYQHSETFRSIVDSVVSALRNFASNVVSAVTGFATWVTESDNAKLALQALGVAVGVAVAAFLGFQAVQAVIGIINAVRMAMLALNASMLANPVVLIVAALAALGAAVYVAYQKFEPFRNAVNATLGVLKSLGATVLGATVGAFQTLWNVIEPVVSVLGQGLSAAASLAWSGLSRLGSIIGGALVSGFNMFVNLARRVVDGLQALWNMVQQGWSNTGLQAAFETIVSALSGITKPINAVKAAFRDVKAAFSAGGIKGLAKEVPKQLSKVGSAFKDFGRDVVGAVSQIDWRSIGSNVLKGLQTAFTNALQSARSAVVSGFNTIRSAFSSAVNDVIGYVSSIDWGAMWDGLKSAISSVSSFAGEAVSAIKEIGSQMIDALTSVDWRGAASKIVQTVTSGISAGASAARNLWGWLTDSLSSAFESMQVALNRGIQLAWDMITQLDWSDYISEFAWEAWATILDWAAFIGGKIMDFAGWLAEKVSDIPWSNIIGTIENFAEWLAQKVTNIPWATIIGTIEDFASWLAGIVSDIPWATIIGTITNFAEWLAGIVSDIPWGDLIGRIKNLSRWLADKVSDIPWRDLIGRLKNFAEWLAGIVTNIPWTDIIGGIKNFAEWLAGIVTNVPWSTIIGTIDDFPSWLAGIVTNIPWPSASDILGAIPWPDFPSIEWPSKEEILNVIKGALGGDSGSSQGYNQEDAYQNGGLPPGLQEQDSSGFSGSSFMSWNPTKGGGSSGPLATLRALRNEFVRTTQVVQTESSKWQPIASVNAMGMVQSVQPSFTGVRTSAQRGLQPVPPTVGSLLGAATSAAVSALASFGSNAAAKFGQVPTDASTHLGPLSGLVGGYMSDTASQPATHLAGMSLAATAAFLAITMAAGLQLGQLVTIVSEKMQAANEAARKSFVTFVADTIAVMGGWTTGIQNMLNTFASSFHPPISQGTSAGKQSFITFVAGTIAVMGGWSSGITTNVTNTMSTFRSRLGSGTSAGKQTVVTFASDTIAVMGGWSNGIKTSVTSTMSTFKQQISQGTSDGKRSFTTFSNDTRSAMSSWSSSIRSTVQSAMNGVRSAIQSGMSSATSIIRSQANSWASVIASAAGAMRSAGSSVGYAAGQGVYSGMMSALGMVRAAANALIAEVDRAMRAKARIASPSKMTTYFGQMIGEGLVVGMQDMLADVSRMGARLAGEALVPPALEPVPAVAHVPPAHSGSTTIVVHQTNYYTVDVDDLEDLNEAVEFVRDLPVQRELVFGQA